ncbi:MAG: hypothetical protein OEZ48_02445, partial [Candidatus Bathyarchaeota archaeon]|nr:hypothetical protein [Candidatus Bathyarchaeota archaeon]
ISLPMSTISQEEADGFLAFIYEFLQGHTAESAELFRIDPPIKFGEETIDSNLVRKLYLDLHLAPYEHGIAQSVSIIDNKELETSRHSYQIHIHRKLGPSATWISLNRPFVDSFRKQIFLWRSFRAGERERYTELFEELNIWTK